MTTAPDVTTSDESEEAAPAYLVATFTIEDRAWVREYVRQVKHIVSSLGGRYLARSSDPRHVEGDFDADLVVILEFPSFAVLSAFYEDERYRPLRDARIAGTKGNVYLVPGEKL
jgi:uncharacterized protein (DUF1330 family)